MLDKFITMILNLDKCKDYTENEQAYIRYGLQILLLLVLELIVLLLFACFFNIFWPVITALISFLVIRPYAGGVHMPSYSLCMFVSLLIFLAIGLISVSITINSSITIIVWISIVLLIGILMINKYAPADTSTVPISDPDQRKLMKETAKKILIIWTIVSIITALLFKNSLHIIFASSLGILCNILIMHPFFFIIVKKYLTTDK